MSERINPDVYDVTITGDPSGVPVRCEQWKANEASHFVRRRVALVDQGEPRLQIDPATDASGALLVTQTIPGTDRRAQMVTTWTLRPLSRPRLTNPQYDDLRALRSSTYEAGASTGARYPGGRLREVKRAGAVQHWVALSDLSRISPARWRKLVEKGWLSLLTGHVEDGAPVVLTLAGRIALTLAEHQTRTSSPTGYVHAADHPHPDIAASGAVGPWRHGGKIYDGTSWPVCSCGALRGKLQDRRYLAQSVTRAHRAQEVMRALGASAEQCEAAGQRAGVIGGSRRRPGVAGPAAAGVERPPGR